MITIIFNDIFWFLIVVKSQERESDLNFTDSYIHIQSLKVEFEFVSVFYIFF